MQVFTRHCFEKNLQLTPLRKKILEFLLRDHKPLGAYEILALLSKEGLSSKPPIAYRVLDFLMKEGFVHKIKGLNAFIACTHPGNHHSPAFMICKKCDKVAEVEDKIGELNLKKTSPINFRIEETFVEIMGVCDSCSGLGAT